MEKILKGMRTATVSTAFVIAVLASLLISCESTNENINPVQPADESSEAVVSVEELYNETETDYSTGSPWLYSSVRGVIDENTPTNLKDDYYLAVNKDTIINMEYHPGRITESNLGMAMYDVQNNKISLMKDDAPASHEAQLVHDYYLALNDWNTRTSVMESRTKERLEKISNLTSMADYCSKLYDWNEDNALLGFLDTGLTFASYDSSTWIAGLYFSNLTLNDAAEYTNLTENGQIRYMMLKDIYTYALDLIGEDTSHAAGDIDQLITFESKIAQHSMTVEEKNRAESIELMDNYLSIEEINEMLGDNYDFRYMLEKNDFVPDSDILVAEPETLKFYGEILNDDSYLDDIKNREKILYLISYASSCSKESMYCVQEIQNAYTGVEEVEEYDKLLLSSVDSVLNEPLQIAYVNAYASEEIKANIAFLCREIADEYCEMLKEADWISESTRTAAIEKLERIHINSTYPEKWYDYSGLNISGMNLFEANAEITKFNNTLGSSLLNTKIDNDHWLMDCTATNAFYMPNNNSIYILLGFLGDNTYSPDMAWEELLGRIGFVIGHEISHAFDSSGGQFDSVGNMVDWWTDADKQAFDARIQNVRNYFDGITIYGDKHLVGSMLDGEATADITSLECLLRIADKNKDFDYNLFFRSIADMWAESMLPFAVDYYYIYDTHAPNYLRVNVSIQQFDKFFETYGITKDDGMYLAPEDRILVW